MADATNEAFVDRMMDMLMAAFKTAKPEQVERVVSVLTEAATDPNAEEWIDALEKPAGEA